jgi:hypothetical protein
MEYSNDRRFLEVETGRNSCSAESMRFLIFRFIMPVVFLSTSRGEGGSVKTQLS